METLARPAPAAAAGAPPHVDDVEMGDGDSDAVDVGEADGAGIVDEAVILQEDGQPVSELSETPKPKKKATKRARERDDITTKVLNLLEKDAENDDEVSLALASIGKRILRSLKEGQIDAAIKELNEVVGCHVRAARSGDVMCYQRHVPIQQPPQIQPPPQQQQQPSNFQQMPPPPLHRLDSNYDLMTNSTYQNL